jgi:hypothetical protein
MRSLLLVSVESYYMPLLFVLLRYKNEVRVPQKMPQHVVKLWPKSMEGLSVSIHRVLSNVNCSCDAHTPLYHMLNIYLNVSPSLLRLLHLLADANM